MADHFIFFGWKGAVPGREKQALELGQKAGEFWNKMHKDGLINNVRMYVLTPHGGDLNYFWIVSGEADKLAQVKQDPKYIEMLVESDFCLQSYGAVDGVKGKTASSWMDTFRKLSRV